MSGFRDMNGLWSGWYGYGLLSSRVPFTAWIDETALLLTGTIMEPNTFAKSDLEDLQAEIAGTRQGQSILFSKTYRERQGAHGLPISYEGTVDERFQHVAGEWRFVSGLNGSGPFELSRSSRGISEGILREVLAPIDA